MKKLLLLCTTLSILFLSACSHAPSPPEIPPGTGELNTAEQSISAYEETEKPAGETTSTCSQPGKETSTAETASTTGESLNTTEPVTTDIPPTTESEDERVAQTTSATETPKPSEPGQKEDPVKTEPPKSSEPVETETIPPSAKPTEEPTEAVPPTTPDTTPEETTEPPSEETTEPPFDINYWFSYCKEYALNVGLTLDPEAVYCWDNPIGAGAHCLYLEQDIQSRLNRYANDGDITDVWIWAEETREDRYNLYIGYV